MPRFMQLAAIGGRCSRTDSAGEPRHCRLPSDGAGGATRTGRRIAAQAGASDNSEAHAGVSQKLLDVAAVASRALSHGCRCPRPLVHPDFAVSPALPHRTSRACRIAIPASECAPARRALRSRTSCVPWLAAPGRSGRSRCGSRFSRRDARTIWARRGLHTISAMGPTSTTGSNTRTRSTNV